MKTSNYNFLRKPMPHVLDSLDLQLAGAVSAVLMKQHAGSSGARVQP